MFVAALVAMTSTTPAVAANTSEKGAHACAGRAPFSDALAEELDQSFAGRRFTASVIDLRSGCTHDFRPDERITTASVIKITIMAAVLLRAQDEGRALSEWELSQISPMIAESDDASASALWVNVGGAAGIQAVIARFELSDTVAVEPKWGASVTSAADQAKLIRAIIVGPGPLEEAGRATARDFLLTVVPDQQWGVTAGLAGDWLVPMKNGFFDSIGWDWRINTVGFIEDPAGSGYALAILSDGWSAQQPGVEAVELIARVVARHLNSPEPPTHPFVDVPIGAYYDQGIGRLQDRGVVEGTSPLFFAPADPVVRSQLALFLHRLAGEPAASGDGSFDDVDAASPYAPAVAWLAAQGITVGTAPGTFSPDSAVTRGQAAVFIHRSAGSPTATTAVAFTDVAADTFYAEAVWWMVEAGITVGTTPSTFSPHQPLTRAQMVAFLDRWLDIGGLPQGNASFLELNLVGCAFDGPGSGTKSACPT